MVWTPGSLYRHFTDLLAQRDAAVDKRLTDNEVAIKARANEVQQRYVSEDTYTADKERTDERLDELENAKRANEARKSGFMGVGRNAGAALGFLLTVLYIYTIVKGLT